MSTARSIEHLVDHCDWVLSAQDPSQGIRDVLSWIVDAPDLGDQGEAAGAAAVYRSRTGTDRLQVLFRVEEVQPGSWNPALAVWQVEDRGGERQMFGIEPGPEVASKGWEPDAVYQWAKCWLRRLGAHLWIARRDVGWYVRGISLSEGSELVDIERFIVDQELAVQGTEALLPVWNAIVCAARLVRYGAKAQCPSGTAAQAELSGLVETSNSVMAEYDVPTPTRWLPRKWPGMDLDSEAMRPFAVLAAWNGVLFQLPVLALLFGWMLPHHWRVLPRHCSASLSIYHAHLVAMVGSVMVSVLLGTLQQEYLAFGMGHIFRWKSLPKNLVGPRPFRIALQAYLDGIEGTLPVADVCDQRMVTAGRQRGVPSITAEFAIDLTEQEQSGKSCVRAEVRVWLDREGAYDGLFLATAKARTKQADEPLEQLLVEMLGEMHVGTLAAEEFGIDVLLGRHNVSWIVSVKLPNGTRKLRRVEWSAQAAQEASAEDVSELQAGVQALKSLFRHHVQEELRKAAREARAEKLLLTLYGLRRMLLDKWDAIAVRYWTYLWGSLSSVMVLEWSVGRCRGLKDFWDLLGSAAAGPVLVILALVPASIGSWLTVWILLLIGFCVRAVASLLFKGVRFFYDRLFPANHGDCP